jgi:hypothetical protein
MKRFSLFELPVFDFSVCSCGEGVRTTLVCISAVVKLDSDTVVKVVCGMVK